MISSLASMCPPAARRHDGTMLEIQNITQKFGKHTALEDVSFTVPDGHVTAFVGPNGAGKTTTMRIAIGLQLPTSGTAVYDGVPLSKLREVGSVVSAVMDVDRIHPSRTAYGHLKVLAALQGLSSRTIDAALDTAGIASVKNRRVKDFSLGMRQRLGVASALLGDPKHLLFDEPLNGLDPDGVVWMRELIASFARRGKAVLVSSHLLSEVQMVADRLVVIGEGHILDESSMDDFTATGNLEQRYFDITRNAVTYRSSTDAERNK